MRASVIGAAVNQANGAVQWSDLTAPLGDLAPGAIARVDLTYRLTRVAEAALRRVAVADARDQFGDPLAAATAEALAITPGLSAGIAAEPAAGSQVRPGRVGTDEIQVLNTGDTLLTSLAITAALTGDGAFLDAAQRSAALLTPCPLAEEPAAPGAARIWRVAALEAGASCGVMARVRVAAAPEQGEVTLAAAVQSAELAEPVAAEASHPVFPAAPLVASFTAISTTAGIQLSWATAWEKGLEGFHVWRGTTSVLADAVRVTPALLPATGAPAAYTYRDLPPQTGAYYYWLEPVGEWSDLYAGPVAVRWNQHRILLPLVFKACAAHCGMPTQQWLPLIFHQR